MATMYSSAANVRCPGPMDRRTWLKIGGLSLGALGGGGSPSLARLLAADAQQGKIDKDFSVILFWANGGPSHLDTFDLKPEAPAEFRGPFQPIATNVPGMEITELLPNLARMGDRFSLLRSLHHDRNQHSGGTNRLLTGYPSLAANPMDAEFPEIGSVVAKHLENKVKDIPLFIANTKFYGGGPAYLGPAYSPFMPNPNPLSSSGANQYDPIPIYPADGNVESLTIGRNAVRNLRTRQDLLKTFDTLRRDIDQSGSMAALDRFNQQAVDLLSSPTTRDAFDLSKEDPKTRRRYGDTHWGRSLLTCRRLVEAGVRFVQCQATFRLKKETGRTSNWDDHSVNAHIFNAFREKMPVFDMAVPALIEDLHRRGLNKNVLFVFCGEFGRTPKINKNVGRDHWGSVYSTVLAGGGIRGGQVYGASDRNGARPARDPVHVSDFVATLYHALGYGPETEVRDHQGRPRPIVQGRAVTELF